MRLKTLASALAFSGLLVPGLALATNGMNMEGYGPVSTGMGGASYAYDNGTAGLINNPATLGLMRSGSSRLDVAVGGLHPDVTTKMAGMPNAHSGGDAYYMPAVGYVRKDGRLTWGGGMMAQGGMGTEYGRNSLLSGYQSAAFMLSNGMMGTQGMSGVANRSELGIGRVMIPLAFDVSDTFRVGGTLDYLWGGLDLQMMMSGAMFASFTGFGGAAPSPLGFANGSLVTAMGGFGLADLQWAQFDFSQGKNGMKQKLKTNGWAGNIGFVWQATPSLSIGGVYHGKTSLADMKGNGRMNMSADLGGGPMPLSVSGKLKVVDFQWPETYGLGLSYKVNDRFMLAADYKRIGWSGVMNKFRMVFTAEGNGGMLAGLNGTVMDATLWQKWKNQNVFMIGGAYKVNDAFTLRAGLNLASNPIPNKYMNPLFPATIKNHVTFGAGYAFNPVSSIDFSLSHAPQVSATNANMGGVKTTHSQTNWQLMYSHRF
ncbi:MAG TPA: outer membrane protein transport protein [Candidatus Desulfobacillus sp.]|nr:outer membrane protein transport protein [Candidatus Desulfobacillus sp.]